MIGKAKLKNVPITPKKMRMIVNDVKKLSPQEALIKLRFNSRRSSSILLGVIKSALNNLQKIQSINPDKVVLKFKTLKVDEGRKVKRWRAGSRGTPKMFVRRYSHINVEIELVTKENGKNIETKKSVDKNKKDKNNDNKLKKVVNKSVKKVTKKEKDGSKS